MTFPPSKSLLQYVPSAVGGSPAAQVCAWANVAPVINNVIAMTYWRIVNPGLGRSAFFQ
jgi:hypothetical protein